MLEPAIEKFARGLGEDIKQIALHIEAEAGNRPALLRGSEQ